MPQYYFASGALSSTCLKRLGCGVECAAQPPNDPMAQSSGAKAPPMPQTGAGSEEPAPTASEASGKRQA
jgi:hypothetical protein